MKIILVDDEEQVLKGVSRIITCEEDDWEVETALSGETALEMMEEDKFDVIISDMRMPGMDGAELLKHVAQRFPYMLRVVLSGQADRETVLRAVEPMHQYLAKPCDSEKLFEVIRQSRIFQETITSAEVLDAIGQANCLPSFPEIVEEINREIESDDGTAQTIAGIVAKDPILLARLLQLANSAIFAMRNPIVDIDRAVSLIGSDMVRSIALSQSVYASDTSNDRILPAQKLLEHGFRVAVVGKQIAKFADVSTEVGNTVFAAGLLHDAGKLILLNSFPEKYKQVLAESFDSTKSLSAIEMDMFGASHEGVGGYLFGLWGLPPEVIESVEAHHSFSTCMHAIGRPSQLVFAANWIVNGRTQDELDALANAEENQEEAKQFADQIARWTEEIERLGSEE